MALYDRGNLPANASAVSPEYRGAAFKHYQADLAPVRRQALLELDSKMGGRGLGQSGQALLARLQSKGGFIRDLGQRRQALGLEQARLAEGERQLQQDRAWQLQDQAAKFALEDELAKWAEEDYQTARRMAPMKKLMGGIGRLGGALGANAISNWGKKGLTAKELEGVADFAGPPPTEDFY